MNWHTEKRKISELKEWKDNPRKPISDKEYENLKKSLTKRGFYDILKIDENNVVLSGNQRLKALKELGYEEVECKVSDEILTQEQKDAVALESNTHGGEWDMDKLADGFGDVMEEIGFGDLMPEVELDVKEDDYEELEDLETTVVLGDVYQLGEHRLMCGDSTKIEDVEKLMNGEKADMVFTDPPYGMNLDTDWSELKGSKNTKMNFKDIGGGGVYKPVIGDNDDFNPQFILGTLDMFDYCKEVFMWGGDYYCKLLPDTGTWIIWDKRLNDSADKMIGSSFEVLWSKYKHKKDIIRVKWAGVYGLASQDTRKRVHPTQKPLEVSTWVFDRYSEEGDIVVDLFGGSGSTLIACEQTNRKCYMMELDPYYTSVIINHWETYTGNKAVKLED